MTTPDMMEALQALAAEKGMTTELLLEAVANGCLLYTSPSPRAS